MNLRLHFWIGYVAFPATTVKVDGVFSNKSF